MKVEPLHENTRDCFIDCLVSVCNYIGRGYLFMFADAWDFSFAKESKDDKIGSRVGWGEYRYDTNLKKYYDIACKEYEFQQLETFIDKVKEEVEKGMPSILKVDSYILPWDNAYQTRHNRHYIILTGIDETINQVYVTDPFNLQCNEPLSISSLETQKTFKLTCFNIGNGKQKELDVKEGLKGIARRHIETGMFDKIRAFANASEQIDILKELPKEEIIWVQPLFVALKNITNSRWQFSHMLCNLARQYPEYNLETFIESFNGVISKWTGVISTLIKAQFKAEEAKYLVKIKERLLKIADAEEKLAYDLLMLLDNKIERKDEKEYVISTKVNKQYIPIDLKPYVNNRGFSYLNDEIQGNLTGMNEYFLYEGIEVLKGKCLDSIKFEVPLLETKYKDNISCQGQAIALNNVRLNEIHILACAEWGNYSEEIQIVYASGEIKKYKFNVSDWDSKNLAFSEDEQIVLPCIKGKDRTVSSIYTQCIAMKSNNQVKSIVLPNCNNIHIFAITLGVIE